MVKLLPALLTSSVVLLSASLLKAQVQTVPYFDDFDSGAPGWISDSVALPTGSHWQLGSPAYGVTSSAYSGTTCWDIELSAAYANNSLCGLISPPFDFNGVQAIRISFRHNRRIEDNWDGYVLQYTTDTITNPWNIVGAINAPFSNNWYADSLVGGPIYQCWSGNSNGWEFSSIIIPSPSTTQRVYFRFRFSSDGSVVQDGVSIDDFSIEPIDINVITGTVYLDQNSNYIIDGADTTLPGIVLNTISGSSITYQMNNASGDYSVLATPNVSTSVTPVVPMYSTSQPPSYTITLSGTNQTSTGNDFLITFLPGVMDPAVQLNGGTLRPGLSHTQFISYTNLGTTPVSGTISLQYSSYLDFQSASQPSVVTGPNTREFAYNLLLPGHSGNIVCSYIADSTLVIGNTATSYVVITPLTGDTHVVNNYDTLISVATNSMDPNNKLAEPEGDIPVTAVNAGLDIQYTVNFQNTGNAPAIHINIYDQLDNNLDLSTFELTGSTHPVTSWSIGTNRTLHVSYANINLPDSLSDEPGSHGQFRYRIRPLTSLQPGENITNTAAIYFDNNLPVITNSVVHTVVVPVGLAAAGNASSMSIYPNPAGYRISVISPSGYQELQLINSLGQTVMMKHLNDRQHSLEADISELPTGLYLLRLTGESQSVLSSPLIITR